MNSLATTVQVVANTMPIYNSKIQISKLNQLGGGATWNLSALTDLTLLFGKNGSGKSVLLRAWRDIDSSTVHYVAPERTGEIVFNPNFMQQQVDGQGRRESSIKNFVPQYREQVISRIQSYFVARGSFRGKTLPGDPSELESFINRLVPEFSISITGRNPPYQIVRLANNQPIAGVDQLSSGEAQIVTVALDILTISAIWELEGKGQRILLIDEPDAHIHPDLQLRFADFIIQVLKRFSLQIVVATHSTTLLSAFGQFGGPLTSVIYLNRTRDDYQAEVFSDVLKEVAACLGGHVLMGTLFGAQLLLVEGDDDYRIWSQVPRHNKIDLAVIPANGDEIRNYQKTLEKIIGSLREPSVAATGFALLDGDKALPTPSTVPQNHIRFIRLCCREAENLFLADEVLQDLQITWADAATKIVQESHKFGNKQTRLAQAPNWDRKSVDIKDVINELSMILDPKNVHWTIRTGHRIGREKPTGQLLDFLGQEVVSSLWGSP
jgi:predicted ATPase